MCVDVCDYDVFVVRGGGRVTGSSDVTFGEYRSGIIGIEGTTECSRPMTKPTMRGAPRRVLLRAARPTTRPEPRRSRTLSSQRPAGSLASLLGPRGTLSHLLPSTLGEEGGRGATGAGKAVMVMGSDIIPFLSFSLKIGDGR